MFSKQKYVWLSLVLFELNFSLVWNIKSHMLIFTTTIASGSYKFSPQSLQNLLPLNGTPTICFISPCDVSLYAQLPNHQEA